jgi:type III secretion protein J
MHTPPLTTAAAPPGNRPQGPRRIGMAWAAVLVLAALCGCQMELHTKAKETDANEMLGALLAAGLDARKSTPDGGKTWSISVDESQTVQAIDVLRVNALPRERRDSMGELFKKEGLISSPTEERVRFIFGIEQGLAETVSKIDGVMVARVHIVLPNNDPLASNVKPSSASVFVKHRRGADLPTLTPAIKNLVVHAVEGLGYDQVTVTLVPASAASEASIVPAALQAGAGSHGSMAWVAGASITIVLLLAALAVLARKKGWLPGSPAGGAVKSRAGDEPAAKAAETAA